MKAENTAVKPSTANGAFSALVFAVLGWAVLETQLFGALAGLKAHLLASAMGLSIAAIALWRCRRMWPLFADSNLGIHGGARTRFDRTDAAGAAALLAAGGGLGFSASAGSVVLIVFCVVAFGSAPWSKIGFCRRHFYGASMVLGAGAAPVLMAKQGAQHPLFYLLCAWMLWSAALLALLVTWKQGAALQSPPGPPAVREFPQPADQSPEHQ